MKKVDHMMADVQAQIEWSLNHVERMRKRSLWREPS